MKNSITIKGVFNFFHKLFSSEVDASGGIDAVVAVNIDVAAVILFSRNSRVNLEGGCWM